PLYGINEATTTGSETGGALGESESSAVVELVGDERTRHRPTVGRLDLDLADADRAAALHDVRVGDQVMPARRSEEVQAEDDGGAARGSRVRHARVQPAAVAATPTSAEIAPPCTRSPTVVTSLRNGSRTRTRSRSIATTSTASSRASGDSTMAWRMMSSFPGTPRHPA